MSSCHHVFATDFGCKRLKHQTLHTSQSFSHIFLIPRTIVVKKSLLITKPPSFRTFYISSHKLLVPLNCSDSQVLKIWKFDNRKIGKFDNWTIGQLENWKIWQLENWKIWQLDNWTIGQFDNRIFWQLDNWTVWQFDNWTTLAKHPPNNWNTWMKLKRCLLKYRGKQWLSDTQVKKSLILSY